MSRTLWLAPQGARSRPRAAEAERSGAEQRKGTCGGGWESNPPTGDQPGAPVLKTGRDTSPLSPPGGVIALPDGEGTGPARSERC